MWYLKYSIRTNIGLSFPPSPPPQLPPLLPPPPSPRPHSPALPPPPAAASPSSFATASAHATATAALKRRADEDAFLLSPDIFEGAKFEFNKTLTQKFALVHNVALASGAPGSYEFGANFGDEAVLLASRIDLQGRLNGRLSNGSRRGGALAAGERPGGLLARGRQHVTGLCGTGEGGGGA